MQVASELQQRAQTLFPSCLQSSSSTCLQGGEGEEKEEQNGEADDELVAVTICDLDLLVHEVQHHSCVVIFDVLGIVADSLLCSGSWDRFSGASPRHSCNAWAGV